MWVKQCHKPSPSHHHFYRWYKPCIPKWVVYDIVLTTLYQQIKGRNDEFRSTRTAIAVRIGKKMKKWPQLVPWWKDWTTYPVGWLRTPIIRHRGTSRASVFAASNSALAPPRGRVPVERRARPAPFWAAVVKRGQTWSGHVWEKWRESTGFPMEIQMP